MNFELENFRGMPSYETCPGCRNEKVLRRYVYKETGVQVANEVGLCKRKKECGYHYTPYAYWNDNKSIDMNPKGVKQRPSFIPHNDFLKSLDRYEENNFSKYLKMEFGDDEAKKMMAKYKVGTSKAVKGGTIFWEIDREEKVRTGHVINFFAGTGNEHSYPFSFTCWVHRCYKIPSFNYVPCYFGEHLLNHEQYKTVVVVKSEKAAIIGSHLYPEYIWLGYNKRWQEPDLRMFRALSTRKVIWFPYVGFEKLKDNYLKY